MSEENQDNGCEEERERLQEKRPQCSVDLQSMENWIEGDTTFCRPCILPVTIDWYRQELAERGHPELVEELDRARMSEDPDATCRIMDTIKDKVQVDLRYRLMEFDCSTQEHAAQMEEEGILLPDEASPEPSPPDYHNLDTASESLPETLPPELPETEL
ncbi:MAG: hypothetical protein KKB59_20020 [Spirochaetes bacterium]|nr:hypothetical protein [Spirochaetota bacterium]